jgi:hypothetical protein
MDLDIVWSSHLDCVVRRGQIHYKTNIMGKNMAKSTVSLLNRSANFASRTSQDSVDGLSDESDGETSTKKKRTPRRGRKKATVETSRDVGEEIEVITEQTAAEETKEVKRRGRKKGKYLHIGCIFAALLFLYAAVFIILLDWEHLSKSQFFSVLSILLQLLLLQAQKRRRIRPRNRRRGDGEKLRL